MKFINFIKNHFAIIGTIILLLILISTVVFPSIIIVQNYNSVHEPDFIMGETEYGLSVLHVSDSGMKKTKLTIPQGVKYIGRGAFLNSITTLVEIDIPASVEVVEDYAFAGLLNLENVYFESNSSLKTIGEYAFSECLRLKRVTFILSVH